jgi:hypothetical protein
MVCAKERAGRGMFPASRRGGVTTMNNGSNCYQRLAATESSSVILQPTLDVVRSSGSKRTALVGRKKKQTASSAASGDRIACYMFLIVTCFWFSAIALLVTNLDSEIGLRQSYSHSNNNSRNRTAAMELLMQQRGYHILPKYPINHQAIHIPLSIQAIHQCNRALWHTLETTTTILPNNETFVITGDIPDLWLRDSAAQIHPLHIPNVYYNTANNNNNNNSSSSNNHRRTKSLIQVDTKLERIVSGLILKTARYIRFDPYANAFKIHDMNPTMILIVKY